MSKITDTLRQLNQQPASENPLVRTRFMKEFATQIFQVPPDWDNITLEFVQTPQMHYKNLLSLPGTFAELYLHQRLSALCDKYSLRAQKDPIPPYAFCTHYNFRYYAHNVIVSTHDQVDVTEYDAVCLLEGIPVLLESKLTYSSIRSGREVGVNEAMRLARLKLITHPLREYFFKEKCGMMHIIYPERKFDNKPQDDFRKLGGSILKFYKPRDEYLKEVADVVQQFGLSSFIV